MGEPQKTHDDLLVVIDKNPETDNARPLWIKALARLAKTQAALSELAKFQKGDAPESSKLGLATVVAAELGEGFDRALEAIETAIKNQPWDKDLGYAAACALALASKAISRTDQAKGGQLALRSLELVRELVKHDSSFFQKMDDEPDLDPIRDHAQFAGLMSEGHPDRRYAAVRSSDVRFEAIAIFGLEPAAHVLKGRELMASDFRPISWSITRTPVAGSLVSASVWHRPVMDERVKDHLAERQSRAAIALGRLGRAQRKS